MKTAKKFLAALLIMLIALFGVFSLSAFAEDVQEPAEHEHQWSEYVYKDDGGVFTFGTKTATCEICGTTDT
ncbi:MAG: hypothetical protein IJL87_03980 [Clostridia bacterium]|nr:hypothetical protein [Clostridia bacterium]